MLHFLPPRLAKRKLKFDTSRCTGSTVECSSHYRGINWQSFEIVWKTVMVFHNCVLYNWKNMLMLHKFINWKNDMNLSKEEIVEVQGGSITSPLILHFTKLWSSEKLKFTRLHQNNSLIKFFLQRKIIFEAHGWSVGQRKIWRQRSVKKGGVDPSFILKHQCQKFYFPDFFLFFIFNFMCSIVIFLNILWFFCCWTLDIFQRNIAKL